MDTAKKHKLPAIAFIVGMGRSGTTLLANILNSNTEVIATPENEFLLFTYKSFSNKTFDNSAIINSFLNVFNFNFNRVLSIWKPPTEKLKSAINSLVEKNFANVCKSVYLNYPFSGNKPAIKYVVDKNPIYSLFLSKINKLYPEAKLIVITRDFRDNVLSRKKYTNSNKSIYNLAVTWNFYYEQIFRDIERFNLNYHLIRYEDMVSAPGETIKALCAYLEIDYSDEMLNFQNLSREIKNHIKQNETKATYEKIERMHANLESKINSTRVNAYEKELNSDEILMLNHVCRKFGNRFNYLAEDSTKQGVKLKWVLCAKFAYIKVYIYYLLQTFYYNLPVSMRLFYSKK